MGFIKIKAQTFLESNEREIFWNGYFQILRWFVMFFSIIILQLLCLFVSQGLTDKDCLLRRCWRDVMIYPFRLWLRVSPVTKLDSIRYLDRVRIGTNGVCVCFYGSLSWIILLEALREWFPLICIYLEVSALITKFVSVRYSWPFKNSWLFVINIETLTDVWIDVWIGAHCLYWLLI